MFHYPILPETPCFAHPDGPLRESEKPSVFHLLKGSINLPIPGDVNAVIADGMFIIQTSVKEKTTTFAAFARSALLKIDLIYVLTCMNYLLLKILNVNHEMRILKNILHLDPTNAFQKTKLLTITFFKHQLLRFLYKEYEDPVYKAILGKKVF